MFGCDRMVEGGWRPGWAVTRNLPVGWWPGAVLALMFCVSLPADGQQTITTSASQPGLVFLTGESLFGTCDGARGQGGIRPVLDAIRPYDLRLDSRRPPSWPLDVPSGYYYPTAANAQTLGPPGSLDVSFPEEKPEEEQELAANDRIFFRGWLLITTVEVVLLGVTALMPKDWTGWSSTFVKDGMGNLQDAYSDPPVWDTDHWFHNYIGHPYGGNVYYNTVRSQGAKKGQSFLFSMALSIQWEYVFEAVAEQPSIQDLFITPVFGSLLGEFVHNLTATFKKNGTSLPEKIIMTILNPTGVWYNGYN